MFLTNLAAPPRYRHPEHRLTERLAKQPAPDYGPLIHYSNSPAATITACGIYLTASPGVRYTVDKNLLVGQCQLCEMVAHLPSKENAMTRAGIDCRLFPADTVLTAGVPI